MSLAPQHIATLNAVADCIVPPDDDSPGAVGSGAAAMLLSLLETDLAHLKNEYAQFLAQLDVESQVVYGSSFVALDAEKQDLLLGTFQTSAFFRMLVEHVQEQYWTTNAGTKLVGFRESTPLPSGERLGEGVGRATTGDKA